MKPENQVTSEPATLPEEPPSATQPTDQYVGQGGTYTMDPVTGLRALVSRTEPCEDCRK